ncbi:cysteine-rich CWC family protein [Silvimonas soli]|uniref:cysteine-rich CWC family protein n=1 Tax=Silvimonas soli TaxID=2980100 RepID=UPI0024B3A674|nr:cysteine-rich CWC family protein [Silvimonas soli]
MAKWTFTHILFESPVPDHPDPASIPASAICPICGALNGCAMVQSGPDAAASCWCMSVTVDATVLNQLPPEQLDRACLCPRCLQAGH